MVSHRMIKFAIWTKFANAISRIKGADRLSLLATEKKMIRVMNKVRIQQKHVFPLDISNSCLNFTNTRQVARELKTTSHKNKTKQSPLHCSAAHGKSCFPISILRWAFCFQPKYIRYTGFNWLTYEKEHYPLNIQVGHSVTNPNTLHIQVSVG
jgi:hypothetical protein